MIFYPATAQTNRQCPNCGSLEGSRLQRIDRLDRLLSRVHRSPERCMPPICNHRFQSFGRH